MDNDEVQNCVYCVNMGKILCFISEVTNHSNQLNSIIVFLFTFY